MNYDSNIVPSISKFIKSTHNNITGEKKPLQEIQLTVTPRSTITQKLIHHTNLNWITINLRINQSQWDPKFRVKKKIYLIGVVELVIHEARDDAGLAHGLVPQEHELVFGQSRYGSHFGSDQVRGRDPGGELSADFGRRVRDSGASALVFFGLY